MTTESRRDPWVAGRKDAGHLVGKLIGEFFFADDFSEDNKGWQILGRVNRYLYETYYA